MAKKTKKTATKKATTEAANEAPAHAANLVAPKGSTECLNCGLVFAGRTNCNNCGYEMTDEQIAKVNEHRVAAGLAPYKR